MLAVDRLTKTFGGFTAVNRVSFEVREGEILGLDRAERVGQEHHLQPDRRRARAERGRDPLPRAQHRGAHRQPRRALRHIFFCNPGKEATFPDGERKLSFHNNQSLVMRLQFHRVAILLAGDIEKEAEARIVRSGHTLKADVLKVPHQGSLSSSTLPFLGQVNPTYAMISVGPRAMGRLPHPEVLRRFQDLSCRVYRTDRHGAMTVVTDGGNIKIIPYMADPGTERKEL